MTLQQVLRQVKTHFWLGKKRDKPNYEETESQKSKYLIQGHKAKLQSRDLNPHCPATEYSKLLKKISGINL